MNPNFCKKKLKQNILLFLFLSASLFGYTQATKGILKGKVIDGTTYRTLVNATVSTEKNLSEKTNTSVDGYYQLNLNEGINTVTYHLEGFQKKIITGIKIKNGHPVYLDIILYPITTSGTYKYKYQYKDSARLVDSVLHSNFSDEFSGVKYNLANWTSNNSGAIILPQNITPGGYKNTSLILKGLNGIIPNEAQSNPFGTSFTISGLGERYNQVLLNGSVLNYFDPLSRSYPIQLLPSEIMDQVSVKKIADASLPLDFSGGCVELKTKDYTDHNFYYIQAGSGISSNTSGKTFYGDKRSQLEFISLAGADKHLPNEFPTIKSLYSFNTKNIQEQVYLSKQLNNNLAPVTKGKSQPDTKFILGFGKIYSLKSGAKINLLGFINQAKSEIFNETIVQVSPNTAETIYPFSVSNKPIILSQSSDSNYHYSSQLSGVINTLVTFGKNKISLRNFLGSMLVNTYTKRTAIHKPDEDTLAHVGLNYTTTQKYFISSQLAGEHVLSPNGKFKMDWQVAYTYINQQNPDDRNFLLRQDLSGTKFEIATPLTNNGFTNSGRLWRSYKDNNFSGAFNLSFPFSLLKQAQVLTGGIYLQQNYRISNADFLLVQGKGYFNLENLLAPERYFPGGLNVTSYYSNATSLNSVNIKPFHRGSYSASSNLGASYIKLDSRLTNQLSLHLGGRMESNSQLVSNTRYVYFAGFRNPQLFPIDENTRITTYNLLPSVTLAYAPANRIKVFGSYYRTVNRPQLQELCKYEYYDAATFMVKTGNPLLGTAAITHYTTGLDFLLNAFSSFTFSAFHKKIDQPIEYIVSNYGKGIMQFTPHNTAPATVKGLDASLRLKLNLLNIRWLSDVSVFANGNYTESKAEAGPLRSTSITEVAAHQLSGSPKYSINTGIVIQQPHFPELTVLYSRTGDYIAALGSGKKYTLNNGNSISAIPDYWIKGREQMDIQIGQKIFKSRIQLIAGINNLLNSAYITYQDLNGNKKFDSPLTVQNLNGQVGYYKSGIDNTVTYTKSQRTYFITVSYLFK